MHWNWMHQANSKWKSIYLREDGHLILSSPNEANGELLFLAEIPIILSIFGRNSMHS